MSAPPPAGSPPPPAGGPPPPVVPPPTADGRAGPRRLTRQLSGRMLGGVATGLAAYLGIDVVVVRIAFVVLAFVPFPGFGLLVYGAMLLLVPAAEDGEAVPARASERGTGFYVGIALVGLATFWLFGAGAALVGGWGGPGRFGGGLLPLLLIGLGVALWVDADRRRASRPAEGTSWSPPSGGPAWSPTADAGAAAASYATATSPTSAAGPDVGDRPTEPVGGPAGPVGPPAGAPAGTGAGDGPPAWMPPAGPAPTPVWEEPPLPRQRPRSPLGRITVGLALLAGGIAWLVDVTTAWRVPLSSTLAIVLGVLGLGLLVGSVAGRARWLALLVAFVLPVTLATAAVEDLGIEVTDGVGSRYLSLTTTGELSTPYRMGAGELRIDVTEVTDPGSERLDVSVGAGELVVIVPEGAGVAGRFRTEVGEIDVLGTSTAGFSIDRDVEVEADPGMPTYLLDARVGAGAIRVRSAPAWAEPAPEEDLLFDDGATLEEDVTSDDDAVLEDDALLEDELTEEVSR